MIQKYREGSYMKIGDTRYHNDLKIIEGRVKRRWWRDRGHRLQTGDLDDILVAKPEVIVIGTGYAGNMRVPEAVRSTIESNNIDLITEKTAEATQTFNRLNAEGRNVAGAFHLTC